MSIALSTRTCPAPAPPVLTSWDPLPETLIREVALCLSIKECFQATRISKTWHAGIDRASTWKQYVLREWPGMHVVVSRLEAGTPGQSELCESFRDLCIKMIKSGETENTNTRSAGDYMRLHEGSDENWSHLFTDIFLLVHVTNLLTDRVVHSAVLDLSDPEVIARLFCKTADGPLKLSGVREHELGAFLDFKATLILIDLRDLRGAGVRVAQLSSVEDVQLQQHEEAFASCLSCQWDGGYYSLGLESYPYPVSVECEISAYRLGDNGASEGTRNVDAENIFMWELDMRIECIDMIDGSGVNSHDFDEVSAAYELLEPLVQSPSLLEWH